MSLTKFNLTLLAALWCGAIVPASGQTASGEREAKLIAILTSTADVNAKSEACRELAPIATAAAVPALGTLLADEKLAHMARYGLEPMPGPEVDAILRQALGQLKGPLQVGVIGSIGVRRDAQAVGALVGLLKAPDPQVQQAAARALGMIATAEAVSGLEGALAGAAAAYQLALCEGLFRCAEARIAEGHAAPAIVIYDKLRALPQAPHQVLAGAWRGAILARELAAGLPLLMEAVRSPHPELATASLRIALEMKGPEVSAELANELGKAPPARQVQLAAVLCSRGDEVALPALLALAKAGDPSARVAAIKAAAEIGNVAAAAPLSGLLGDPDTAVAQAAAAALAGLPGSAVDAMVMGALASSDQAVRLKMLDLARQRRIAAAMPTLLKLMDDEDPALSAAALAGYAELAGEQGLAPLLDKLVQTTAAKQLAAIERALGTTCAAAADPQACTLQLVATLAKAAPQAKAVVLRTLRVTGGPAALAAVRGAVDDADKDVHLAAIRVLGEWPTADAAPVLLELAKAPATPVDGILSLRGYLAMADRPKLPAQAKLAIYREAAALIRRDDEKLLLLGGLAKLADPEGLSLAVPYLDEAAVKGEAAAAVIAMAGKRRPNQHVAATRAALEKVAQVASANPATAGRAQELLQKMASEK
jgi:HEAT repeat protein